MEIIICTLFFYVFRLAYLRLRLDALLASPITQEIGRVLIGKCAEINNLSFSCDV